MRKTIISMGIAFILMTFAVPIHAQQTAQHQQQQMQQMQEMQQRMNSMMERSHSMNQEMNRRMEQAQNEQMRNQYQMMHRFGEQISMTLGNMKNAAERCDLMLRDREMMRDRDMQQDMDRMRNHLTDMTNEMEEALQTMERMVQRMGAGNSN